MDLVLCVLSQSEPEDLARTGKIPTLDDALEELLENYKRKIKS